MDDHYVDIQELCKRYQTNIRFGKTTESAEESLKTLGLNKLREPPKTPEVLKLLKNFFSGFQLLLWFGSSLCLIAYTLRAVSIQNAPTENLYLGCALISVVIFTGIFSYYQEKKTDKIMSVFDHLMPPQSLCFRDGIRTTIPSDKLTVGDIIEVFAGDIIPADIRILRSHGLKVDNSSLSGEAKPVSKNPLCTSDNPLETKNLAFCSTFAVEGSAKGMVVRVGNDTVIGQVADLTSSIESDETLISNEIKSFVRVISQIAMLLGIVFFIIAILMGYQWLDAVVFLIGTIVANVPEGLLVTVTVSLTLTAGKMASKNCLVKNLETVETLGATSVILSDKTGTLTQNKIFVSHVWLGNRIHTTDISENQSEASTYSNLIEWEYLERCIALSNNAEFKPNQESIPVIKREVMGDNTDGALLRCLELSKSPKHHKNHHRRVTEIPFNHDTKFHITINEQTSSGKYIIAIKGAPERIFEKCSTIIINGIEVPITQEMRHSFESSYRSLCEMGERVIGFCDIELSEKKFPRGFRFNTESPNFPLEDLRFLGMLSFIDPPRPGVPGAIAKCKSAKIKIIMITGDHPSTAKAIAKLTGIFSPEYKTVEDISEEKKIPLDQVDLQDVDCIVVHGSELHDMTEDDMDEIILSYPEIIFARMTPLQKILVVESCQRIGAIVAVTGDGVNDCPALRKGNVGIAMGLTGSEVSKKASDLILLDDNFATIVTGIEEGRLIFDNLKKSIAYTLTSNIPEISPFLMFLVLGLPLALGTEAIICIDLGTDMLPAISLAYEAPESDIMKRMPRNPYTDKLVGSTMFSVACGQIGMIQAFSGFFVYFIIMAEYGFLPHKLFGLRKYWDSFSINDLEDSYGQEWTHKSRKVLEFTCQTAFFISIVVVQWADLIICKTRNLSIFSQGMKNWVLNFALILETAIAAFLSYTPGMDTALRMYPLKWHWWLPALPFSLLILIYDEFRKLALRIFPHASWFQKENYY